MSKALESFINYLKNRAKEWGFVANLSRKTGIKTSAIHRYLSGENSPGIDQIEKISEALGLQPWELLKPENAIPSPFPASPTIEALTSIIRDQERRIKEMSPVDSLVKEKPVLVVNNENPDRAWLIDFASTASDKDLRNIRRTVESILSKLHKPKGRSSDTA